MGKITKNSYNQGLLSIIYKEPITINKKKTIPQKNKHKQCTDKSQRTKQI